MFSLDVFKALLLGFTVGLTGALVPGPMLFATIEASLKKGWKAGPEVVLGHMLIEVVLCVLILYGAASLVGSGTISTVSLLGGLVLVAFGLLTIKDAKAAASAGLSSSTGGKDFASSPALAGFLTSVSNPYFWIWWLTAGSALVLQEYCLGAFIAVSYVLGHWLADLSWFTAISASFSRGKTLLSRGMHEKVLYACGIFLVLFGAWFALNYNNPVLLS